ncbi:MAG: rRNA maturation RNase YbeY [Patescibacteria group bacterium]|jgi:probable rRNA maturation factor
MQLELSKRVSAQLVTESFIKTIFSALQRYVKIPDSYDFISVDVVGDTSMQALNKTYRQQNYIPDVLSFPYGPEGGEIVLCYPQAKRQAKAKQVPLRSELAWLLIHGFLHILGYDHEQATAAKIMRPLEQRILQAIKL